MSEQSSGDPSAELRIQRQDTVANVSAAIEVALRAALPAAAPRALPTLAQLLAAVADGTVPPDAAAVQLAADPEVGELLHGLTGRTLMAAGVPLQFEGDRITVGNMTNSEAIAVGRGAIAIKVTHYHQRLLALTPQQQRNRQKMLAKVQRIWIDGVLAHSLYHEVLISLGLREAADAVLRPVEVQVRPADQSAMALLPGTRVREVYAHFDETLLILGAPGAGKTILLLELTRDLLAQARDDEAHPIPVVFPLASWAASRRPLADWLVEELAQRYEVPRNLARSWIAEEWILPLLDGLDEVAPSQRGACVEAINAFRQEHGLLPLVVSSRTAEYDELRHKLHLAGAIVVQPLSRQQVRRYVQEVGLPVTPAADSPLWELLETPLFLHVATLTYVGNGTTLLTTATTAAQQRDQLFAAYVERMFTRNAIVPRFYTPQQTKQWLAWLAWQLQRQSQPTFYLEQLQPEWLPDRSACWRYTVLDRLGGVGIVGLAVGLSSGLRGGLLIGLLLGLLGGLPAGLFGGKHEGLTSLGQGVSQKITDTLLGWLVGGLIWGLGVGLFVGLSGGWDVALLFGLGGGLLFGLPFGLLGARTGKPGFHPRHIVVIEALRWSWFHAWRTALTGLLVGLGIGLLFGLLSWLLLVPKSGLSVGLGIGLFGALVGGLGSGLLFGLLGGLTSGEIPEKLHPNQGIRRSGKYALMTGLVAGLGYGLSFGLLSGLGFALDGGLLLAIAITLAYGGYTYLSHWALRLTLCQRGVMPLDYVRFLDESADRILLRRVGGGYSFVHRLLLDWFAKQYTGPETLSPVVPPPPHSVS